MKICILFLLIACVSISYGSNVSWGVRNRRDILLQRVVIKRTYKLFRTVTATHTFTQKHSLNPKIITFINVTDYSTKGKGPAIALIAGGPRTTFVKLNFKSRSSRGFNCTVEIYGKQRPYGWKF